MKKFNEWAQHHNLDLHELTSIKYLHAENWGKSADTDGSKGFAVYARPLSNDLKPEGNATVFWINDLQRSPEHAVGNNAAVRLVLDPKKHGSVGGFSYVALMREDRAVTLINDFHNSINAIKAGEIMRTGVSTARNKRQAGMIIDPNTGRPQ